MRIFLKAQDKESLVDFIMKNATNESFYKRFATGKASVYR